MQLNRLQITLASFGSSRLPKAFGSSVFYRVAVLFFALTYAYTLSKIPNNTFNDYSNYLIYGEHSAVIFVDYLGGGFVSLLANEPIWLMINSQIALFLQPEDVVRLIVFLASFTVAYLILGTNPKNAIWLIVFLLLPIVVKNFLVHIRQGLGIAVFLIGWFSVKKFPRFFFVALTPFIHSSFFIVVVLLIFTRAVQRLRLGVINSILGFLLVGTFSGFSMQFIALIFGARQFNSYEFTSAGISGLGFVFWLLICTLMISQGRAFIRNHLFEIGSVLFYLTNYFIVEVTARVFESTLLLLLLAGLELNGWRQFAFKIFILAFFIFMWFVRVGQPALGFAIS